MELIRKFAYATVLMLSVFAIRPTLTAGEEVRGTFSLSHKVHWQNVVLPAGDYMFSVKNMGSSEFLTLRGLSGTRASAMLVVNDVRTSPPNETTRLVLVTREGQSFVSSMSLPAYDMTLRFSVPREPASREIASK